MDRINWSGLLLCYVWALFFAGVGLRLIVVEESWYTTAAGGLLLLIGGVIVLVTSIAIGIHLAEIAKDRI